MIPWRLRHAHFFFHAAAQARIARYRKQGLSANDESVSVDVAE